MSATPPIGLRPRWYMDEQRMHEIAEACLRYIEAGQTIPADWVEELAQLILRTARRRTDSQPKSFTP